MSDIHVSVAELKQLGRETCFAWDQNPHTSRLLETVRGEHFGWDGNKWAYTYQYTERNQGRMSSLKASKNWLESTWIIQETGGWGGGVGCRGQTAALTQPLVMLGTNMVRCQVCTMPTIARLPLTACPSDMASTWQGLEKSCRKFRDAEQSTKSYLREISSDLTHKGLKICFPIVWFSKVNNYSHKIKKLIPLNCLINKYIWNISIIYKENACMSKIHVILKDVCVFNFKGHCNI